MLFKKGIVISALCFLSIATGLIIYKIVFLGYNFKSIVPQVNYDVTLSMISHGFGEPIKIQTFLPISDTRQNIIQEVNNSPGFTYELFSEVGGRVGCWTSENPQGINQITYSFTASGQAMLYQINESIIIPEKYPESFQKYLIATSAIQVDHPVITEIYQKVVPDTKSILGILKAIFNYSYGLKPAHFKGLTDAVTAAKLGEASCNGKSRLFAALARKANIPTRLVGGIILENSTKKVSHQWVETFINGYWVPFDTLNNHFAEIPENYLVLYRGDEMLFKHSSDINFDYSFKIRKNLYAQSNFIAGLGEHPLNAYNVWAAFTEIGIPLSLLKIIIMIPLGSFILVILRNIIGLETFGTFLPALIAAACRESGFLWGMIGFILIIAVVSLIHHPMERWGLLHTPKMSILLISVVTVMLALTVIGVKMKLYELSHISLFPIAVLAITSERFALLLVEEGLKTSLKVMLTTILAVGLCFLAMNSLAMESLFLAFPELFLILIVLNLWLGRWIGIRLTEIKRFRWLLRG